MGKIGLLILLFFILFLILPFGYRLKASYSLSNNLGSFSFSIWFIRVKVFIFYIKNGNIYIQTKKQKKEIEIQVSPEQIKYVEQLIKQLKEKVKVKTFTLHTVCGLEDAMSSALLCGIFNDIIKIVLARLKCRKPNAKIKIDNINCFNQNILEISLKTKLSVSIFEILYCLLMASIVTKRSDKYERI